MLYGLLIVLVVGLLLVARKLEQMSEEIAGLHQELAELRGEAPADEDESEDYGAMARPSSSLTA